MDVEGIIRLVAERKIQEAIEDGKFDNLPGKGQPLVFDDDPMTPPHLRMANKVLKNAGVLPDWMQVLKEINTERNEAEQQRARLVREHQRMYGRLAVMPADHKEVVQFAAWHKKSREAYVRRLKNVNTTILKLSMMAPSTVQPVAPYKLKEEIEAFDEAFPPLPHGIEVAVAPEPASEEGRLRSLARTRYNGGEGGGSVRSWKAGKLFGAEAPERVGGIETEDIGRADVPEAK